MSQADASALGAKLLDLLDSSSVNSTYKPALLVAITDHASENPDSTAIKVRELAERVTEMYWPQTFDFPDTGEVLKQNAGGQAKAITEIIKFRKTAGIHSHTIPEAVRERKEWSQLLDEVELSLAEMPIPRLQRGFDPFLYEFDWSWHGEGGWSKKAYKEGPRTIALNSGVAETLAYLAPITRPFILRWWSDKAFKLNKSIEGAEAFDRFQAFLFGRKRIPLGRVSSDLLSIQGGKCLYCAEQLGTHRQVDHFVPWSLGGSDSLTNLAVACVRCNSSKKAILADPIHLESLILRNKKGSKDLPLIASTKNWPNDPEGSWKITKGIYLSSPGERHLWVGRDSDPMTRPLSESRTKIEALLDEPTEF